MKKWSNFILLVTLWVIVIQVRAQESSGTILFGTRINQRIVKGIDTMLIPTCVGKGICQLNSSTQNPEGTPIRFKATIVVPSQNIYIVTMNFNLNTLRSNQDDQYHYFHDAGRLDYIFGSDFSFPDWLMAELGFGGYQPINLENGWNLGIPPDADAHGNITMNLCAFIIEEERANMRFGRMPKKEIKVDVKPTYEDKIKKVNKKK